MVEKIILKIILVYKRVISPNFRKSCRFYPSCSDYCYSAIEKYRVCRGLSLGIKRIARCHPFSSGGVDFP